VFWDGGFSYLEIDPVSIVGHRQVTDAWLAALARRHHGRVATFDEAFASAHADVVEILPA
jgi:predicted nucleic acid-binding protein